MAGPERPLPRLLVPLGLEVQVCSVAPQGMATHTCACVCEPRAWAAAAAPGQALRCTWCFHATDIVWDLLGGVHDACWWLPRTGTHFVWLDGPEVFGACFAHMHGVHGHGTMLLTLCGASTGLCA